MIGDSGIQPLGKARDRRSPPEVFWPLVTSGWWSLAPSAGCPAENAPSQGVANPECGADTHADRNKARKAPEPGSSPTGTRVGSGKRQAGSRSASCQGFPAM